MDLVKTIPLALVCTLVWAQGLSLTIGGSVAGQNYATKSASLMFRVNGCADLSKALVTASAEGSVGGVRRSTPLRAIPAQPAGVYALYEQWGTDGKWVVAITANCGGETTGAIVPVNGVNFVRESIRMLPHGPSKAEIEAALTAYTPPSPAAH